MRKTLKIALLWLVLVILPLPLIAILDTQLVDEPNNLFAYDLGIVAYVWWLAAILLATRPRWLVNSLGLPTVYLTHGLLGVFAIIAATCHKFLAFSMFPMIKQTGNIAWVLEIILIVYAILFLSGWLTDRIAGLAHFKRFLETHFLDHEVSIWIHRLNWVVVALIYTHVTLIGRLSVSGFRLVFNLYTIVAILFYLLWQVRRTRGIVTGTLVKNARLDDYLQELTVKLDASDHQYHAGDFYFLSLQAQGISHASHPFSVSSAPKGDPNTVSFTIHRWGNFTKQLANVKAGTKVKLEGPFGQFDQVVANTDGPVVLYGLGSGVAPLLSLAEQYAGQKDLHLVWSGPEVGDAQFVQQLNSLEDRGVKVDAQQHRFTDDQLQKLISSDEIAKGQGIVVGSSSLVPTVEGKLKQLGFSRRQIHDERITM